MAGNSHSLSTSFLIAIVMFATAKPLAHGLSRSDLFLNIPIQDDAAVVSPLVRCLNINGRLCCTENGNCKATGGPPPLSGALATINCTGNQLTGGSLVVGPVRTDMNGSFNIIVVNALLGSNILPLSMPCTISVNVDRVVCPVLSDAVAEVLRVVNVHLRSLLVPTIENFLDSLPD